MANQKIATLTRLARGYVNALFVHEHLFPIVIVEKDIIEIPIHGKDSFKAINSLRAEYGDSNVMLGKKGDKITVRINPHDISRAIDTEYTDVSEMPGEKINATEDTKVTLELSHEKYAADVAQNPAGYPAGHSVALSGTSQFNDSNSDPVGVVQAGCIQIRKKIGRRPNTLVIGVSVFEELINHPQLVSENAQNQVFPATIETLKQRFNIEDVVIGEAIYLDDSDNHVDLWGKTMVLAYVNKKPQANKKDLSFGYKFRVRKYPYVDSYSNEGGKILYIRNNDKVKTQYLGPDAGYLILAAVS